MTILDEFFDYDKRYNFIHVSSKKFPISFKYNCDQLSALIVYGDYLHVVDVTGRTTTDDSSTICFTNECIHMNKFREHIHDYNDYTYYQLEEIRKELNDKIKFPMLLIACDYMYGEISNERVIYKLYNIVSAVYGEDDVLTDDDFGSAKNAFMNMFNELL